MVNETLTFFCGNREGIRLDLALKGNMQGLNDPDYRGFFEAFGDKASYMIYVGLN